KQGCANWMPARAKNSTLRNSSRRRGRRTATPRRLVWAPRAKEDLREIRRYYRRIASPEVADNLLREIHRVATRVAASPLSWRARTDPRPTLGACSPLYGLLSDRKRPRRHRAHLARAAGLSFH